MLSIEIMDTEFIGTITRCMAFIDEVKSPWLQIYPDFGNLSQWTDTPEDELEVGIDHIIGIHLKDTLPGVFKCVPFGQGTVDFVKLFKKVDELEFQGPFLVEMWADNAIETTFEESVAYIKAAKKWLTEKAGERFEK
jgi:L-ribulose-5-phosphate 3-epimerase/hexulose-6-phosphate isomerase